MLEHLTLAASLVLSSRRAVACRAIALPAEVRGSALLTIAAIICSTAASAEGTKTRPSSEAASEATSPGEREGRERDAQQ